MPGKWILVVIDGDSFRFDLFKWLLKGGIIEFTPRNAIKKLKNLEIVPDEIREVNFEIFVKYKTSVKIKFCSKS